MADELRNVPDVLPHPDPKFNGTIGRTYKDSKADKIPLTKAPAGAPNVLLILIDDSGFGQWGTFGGQIPTPNLDRLAKNGLSYTRFHTTALCSPSRAALLTGRNHHSVGTGVITELGCGYPGYSGQIPKSTAMVSEILRQNGYSTAFFGKNHNIADWETSISGPYDRWPALQGFDHFYGFIGGEANQWAPALYRDTAPVELEVPKGRENDYTLNEALADEVISFICKEKSVTPDRPFFVYYAPGATHAPHHVPKQWIEKFKGKFSQGWDKYREEAHARQIKMGLVPRDTKLTARPKEIPAWDSLDADQKRVAERLMETFAGVAAGGVVAGYALYIKDGKPTYEYNWFTQSRYKVTSSEKLKPGPSTIRVEFKYDGGGVGKGGTASLFVNDKKVGEGRVEKTVPGRFSADETFDIGRDTGSPVSADYASPNPFTGKLKQVNINLGTSTLNDEDQRKERAIHRTVMVATQ